jgi:hypothetical protein
MPTFTEQTPSNATPRRTHTYISRKKTLPSYGTGKRYGFLYILKQKTEITGAIGILAIKIIIP